MGQLGTFKSIFIYIHYQGLQRDRTSVFAAKRTKRYEFDLSGEAVPLPRC